MRHLKKPLTFMVVAGLLFSTTAFAKDDLSLMERSYLTGDWGGTRTKLKENGVDIELEYTSVYQGLASGDGASNDKYGGKADAFITLDTNKLGLWHNGSFVTHLEYSHGKAVSFFSGTLYPVNMATMTPLGAPNKIEATSFYYRHSIDDENLLMFGKINALDLLAGDPFFGGWGIHRFMNLAFVAPPSGVVPPVFMGAVYSLKTSPLSWTFMLFDPNDRSLDYLPNDLFEEGVNFSVTAGYETLWLQRKTNYKLNVTYSTQKGTDLSEVDPNVETTQKKGSYNLNLQFSHTLQETEEGSWGAYVKVAIADGNPNTIKSSFIGGIGGDALFFNRPQDNFGVGAFYYDFSDVLQNALYPNILFHDERGIEAYYNYALTPWFRIGADIQYIHTAEGIKEDAVVVGLRTNIKF